MKQVELSKKWLERAATEVGEYAARHKKYVEMQKKIGFRQKRRIASKVVQLTGKR